MADQAELRRLVLKLLFTVGSHGRLQQHVIDRLPACNTQKVLNMLKGMEGEALFTKERTGRYTARWAYLLTITDKGKAAYVASQTPAPIAAEPQLAIA